MLFSILLRDNEGKFFLIENSLMVDFHIDDSMREGKFVNFILMHKKGTMKIPMRRIFSSVLYAIYLQRNIPIREGWDSSCFISIIKKLEASNDLWAINEMEDKFSQEISKEYFSFMYEMFLYYKVQMKIPLSVEWFTLLPHNRDVKKMLKLRYEHDIQKFSFLPSMKWNL